MNCQDIVFELRSFFDFGCHLLSLIQCNIYTSQVMMMSVTKCLFDLLLYVHVHGRQLRSCQIRTVSYPNLTFPWQAFNPSSFKTSTQCSSFHW